jgi:hypothetical protein
MIVAIFCADSTEEWLLSPIGAGLRETNEHNYLLAAALARLHMLELQMICG